MTGRTCGWCQDPLDPGTRSDAKYCTQRCRQAAWRFGRPARSRRGVVASPGRPLRLAYADPPYPGMAKRYYQHHPDYDGEVDHAALIGRLEGYDGWALSTSAAALPAVLAHCPEGVHVAAWVRGERPTTSWHPLNAWEPVIYHGGRPQLRPPQERRTDVLQHVARARTTDPNRVVGAKPAEFCFWLFELLGAEPGDTLDDLYPGSGGIARAWKIHTADADPEAQPELELEPQPLDHYRRA